MNFILQFRSVKHMKRSFGFLVLYPLLFALFFNAAWALEDKIFNQIGMEFILVLPGSFIMGSPESEPFRDADEIQHRVTIAAPFYLQTTEVTVQQWRAVMGKKMFGQQKGEPDSPVTRVSFYDVQNFIKRLNRMDNKGYRLPSEAQWEYACRAGTTTAYSWGNTIDCSKAMYCNNTKKKPDCTLFYKSMRLKPNQPARVKSFPPNPWGLYDMHGNVWEWCADEYRPYTGAVSDKNYDTMKRETRIRRGGSWFKFSQYLRSANRTFAHPGAKFQTTGFRLVLEAD